MFNVAHPAQSPTSRLLRFAFISLALSAAVNGIVLWSFRVHILEGYGDFTSFYTAGKIVASGQSARLYDPKLEWQIQQQFAANVKIRVGPLPYVRPPYEALLFLPLSHLSYSGAWLVWLVFKVALLVGMPCVLPVPAASARPRSRLTLKTLLCLGFFPVGFDLLQGQDSIFVLALIVGAFRLLVSGRDLLSGIILALALFKFHIIIPLFLILVLRKRARFAFGFLATAVVLFLVSLHMVHWTGVLAYPKFLWLLNRVPAYGLATPDRMPNIRGLIALLVGNQPLTAAQQWFLLLIVMFGLVVAARFWRDHADRHLSAAVSFSIVAILVTSYYSNCSDLTLLLVPLLLLVGPVLHSPPEDWRRTLFLAVCAVLLCTPLLWFLFLRVRQFSWMAFVLILFALSIWVIEEGHCATDPPVAQQ